MNAVPFFLGTAVQSHGGSTPTGFCTVSRGAARPCKQGQRGLRARPLSFTPLPYWPLLRPCRGACPRVPKGSPSSSSPPLAYLALLAVSLLKSWCVFCLRAAAPLIPDSVQSKAPKPLLPRRRMGVTWRLCYTPPPFPMALPRLPISVHFPHPSWPVLLIATRLPEEYQETSSHPPEACAAPAREAMGLG